MHRHENGRYVVLNGDWVSHYGVAHKYTYYGPTKGERREVVNIVMDGFHTPCAADKWRIRHEKEVASGKHGTMCDLHYSVYLVGNYKNHK